MAAPSLDGCLAKIKRADENIAGLNVEIGQALDTYRLVRQPQLRSFAGRIQPPANEQETLIRFGVLAGEIIHHLRSSLDHLVWQLVRVRGEYPLTAHLEFPIFLDPEKFKSAAPRKIQGVPSDAATLIEQAQPYHRGGENDPLWILHDLDIHDKHRVLIVTASAMTMYTRFDQTGQFRGFTLLKPSAPEPGVEIHPAYFPFAPLDYRADSPEVNVNPQEAFQIVFRDFGLAKYEPVIPRLSELSQFVAFYARAFGRFFP